MSSLFGIGGGGNVGASGSFYPYSIDQSLRFDDNDSAYLNRTPSSAGNRKTWTLSMWVKRANLGVHTTLFSAGTASNNQTKIRFVDTNSSIFFDNEVGGSTTVRYYTSNLFRDVSSWYHFVFEVDTTQATDADKVKIYVNGEQVTSFSSTPNYPSLNEDLFVNNTNVHYIGRELGTGYLDAYLAEVNFIDGTALDATSFGETINGVWVPKAYSGSYGTNGFYLPFDDSSAIGDDESGNTNDWTANNLAASDVVPDSPTNNWCVLEALQQRATYGMPTLSEGNLKFGSAGVSSSWGYRASNMEVSSGKWYAECRVSGNTSAMVGVFNTGFYGESHFLDQNPQNNTGGWLIYHDGATTTNSKFDGATASATITDFNENDIVGLELDADNGTVKFYVNGALQTGVGSSGTVDISEGTGDAFRFWSLLASGTGTSFIWNFGQDSTFAGNETAGGNADDNGIGDFAYAPPSGFLALCSANLPEPTISPNAAEQADDYFNTVLYTGNGSTQSITGVGHQPDFVWIKKRSATGNHNLTDVIRGVDKVLFTNSTNAESTFSGGLSSFDSDGFSLAGGDTGFNASGSTYASWNWKAGGTSVSNTDGSITSSVSAAPDAGFSIVSWVGNATDGATVGHGLTEKPEMTIVKSRDGTQIWTVFHKDLATNHVLYLNTTSGQNNSPASFGTHTNQVIGVDTDGATNRSSNMIAYCFHSVEGYSKVGSYVGNGSADGTFVYTGFRPAWIMQKKSSSAGNNWTIYDTARDTFNVAEDQLRPDISNAEANTTAYDILSNGFKFRSSIGTLNGSGATYIYLAFAEAPFKYSLAR